MVGSDRGALRADGSRSNERERVPLHDGLDLI
jgi:hypothetical protein